MKINENIKAHQKRFLEKLKQLPNKISIEAMSHFDKSFSDSGFTDDSLKKWQGRKNKDVGRGILMLTGALRRSISKKVERGRITIFSNSPYAKIHNEGGKMKNGQPMPKRQFVGDSKSLDKKIQNLIKNTLKGL